MCAETGAGPAHRCDATVWLSVSANDVGVSVAHAEKLLTSMLWWAMISLPSPIAPIMGG